MSASLLGKGTPAQVDARIASAVGTLGRQQVVLAVDMARFRDEGMWEAVGFDTFLDWSRSRGIGSETARQYARVGRQVLELPPDQREEVAKLSWSNLRRALPLIRKAVKANEAVEAAVARVCAEVVTGVTLEEQEALAAEPLTVAITVHVPKADAEEFRELLDLATAFCRREDGTVTTGSAVLAALREFSVEIHACSASAQS